MTHNSSSTLRRCGVIAASAIVCMAMAVDVPAQRLTILHTNDTHSHIDPDDKGLGGILRKVVIDSVRACDPYVRVIDAGDIVQGTLYFNLYKGEVENKMMNILGYDIRILGNHEFDNGSEQLSENLRGSHATLLSTNYDFSGPLAGMFQRYCIDTIGEKRVGFIALNLNPKGMVMEGSYDGVHYKDIIKSANITAAYLKDVEGVDAVVAVTHIGYSPDGEGTIGDVDLAKASKDIDVIIGGHSHDVIDPAHPKAGMPWRIANANGDSVLVAQTGRYGVNIGRIVINLSDNNSTEYSLIPINARLDNRVDRELEQSLEPYRHGVDSLMLVPTGRQAAIDLPADGPQLLNFVSDFIYNRGNKLLSAKKLTKADFAIINKGGIRHDMAKGEITEGGLITMMPFTNYIQVVDIKGSDLMSVFDVMASTNGNGVSKGVDVVFDPQTKKTLSAKLNGKNIDPNKTYRVVTINYLAGGGDYMTGFTRGTIVASSKDKVFDELVDYVRNDKFIPRRLNPDKTVRMHPVK
ncbi:MAG TPA: bifunctional UDP-sugar hydrolase/5'-nucleotidase [Muribaculaceae bacterium]|nr:bifunctional UDP-sugar hydrolase/5'-nucleotidase [Muribaculaceae bacterium]